MLSLVLSASLVMTGQVCTPTPKQAVSSVAALNKWHGDQKACLFEIVRLESRWNPKADNKKSSAYGLFQILKTKPGTPVMAQALAGARYIRHRYETPCRALVQHSIRGTY